MLTILTLEIFNSGRRHSETYNNSNQDKTGTSEHVSESMMEKMRTVKEDKLENFITLFPLFVLLLGIIFMYILEKMFLK